MDALLLQESTQVSVQTGIINLAGFAVGIACILITVAWLAYFYR